MEAEMLQLRGYHTGLRTDRQQVQTQTVDFLPFVTRCRVLCCSDEIKTGGCAVYRHALCRRSRINGKELHQTSFSSCQLTKVRSKIKNVDEWAFMQLFCATHSLDISPVLGCKSTLDWATLLLQLNFACGKILHVQTGCN